MDDGRTMDWKAFTIRLIEVLRWPVAFVVLGWIFREPLTRMLHALTGAGH